MGLFICLERYGKLPGNKGEEHRKDFSMSTNTEKRINIRVPAYLHDWVKEKAKEGNRSITAYVIALLTREKELDEYSKEADSAFGDF